MGSFGGATPSQNVQLQIAAAAGISPHYNIIILKLWLNNFDFYFG